MKRITWWPQAWLGLTFNWGALMGFAASQPLAGPLSAFPAPDTHADVAIQTGSAVGDSLASALVSLFIVVLVNAPALLLYAGGVFWTLGYDTIYAVQDLEDDALAGVKSSARRLGAGAPRGVLVFYLIAIALAVAACVVARLGPLFVPILALYALHLIRQARRLNVDDPMGALRLFQSNRNAGLILLAALIAGMWRAGQPWLG